MGNCLKVLFDKLNKGCTYLVLRNWDNIFDEGVYESGHEDIDILCDSLVSFIQLTQAVRVYENQHRDNFLVKDENALIKFDVRWVGDGYYPAEWEAKMLSRRVKSAKGIFIPCDEDYCFSLTYHALLQKPSISDDYFVKLNNAYSRLLGIPPSFSPDSLTNRLDEFMKKESFVAVIPNDPAVFINWKFFRRLDHRISFVNLFRRVVLYVKHFTIKLSMFFLHRKAL